MLKRLISIVVIAIVAVLGAGLLTARTYWISDLLTFVTPWVFLGAILVALVAVAFRRWFVAAAAIVLAAIAGIPTYQARSTPDPEMDGTAVRVATFNTDAGDANPEALLAYLAEEQPDIIVFEEFGPPLEEVLDEALHSIFAYQSARDIARNMPIVVFSRYPIASTEIIDWPERKQNDVLPSIIRTTIEVGESGVTLFAIHAASPRLGKDAWEERNAVLRQIARSVNDEAANGRPVIVAGDFNSPPWSPFFLDFVRSASLSPTEGTFFPSATRLMSLQSWLPAVGAPVDHILVSADIGWTSSRVGADLGSDHRPVSVDLTLPD